MIKALHDLKTSFASSAIKPRLSHSEQSGQSPNTGCINSHGPPDSNLPNRPTPEFSVMHICGNDSPFHAMTQYVIQLSRTLSRLGVDSTVLSDMAHAESPHDGFAEVIAGVDWKDVDAAFLSHCARELPTVLHLHLAHPNHGSVLSPDILAQVPTVITCHEHQTKAKPEQAVHAKYCALAEIVMVASREEAAALLSHREISERFGRRTQESRRILVCPVPTTIEPPTRRQHDLPRSPAVAWFGMFRSGHDWHLLHLIAAELASRLPEVPFRLIGAAINPRAVLSMLDAFAVVPEAEIVELRRMAAVRTDALDTEVLALLRSLLINRWSAVSKLPNVEIHLDQPPANVSKLLSDQTMCGISLYGPSRWSHSGSVAAMLAHGLPVVSAKQDVNSTREQGGYVGRRVTAPDSSEIECVIARRVADQVAYLLHDKEAWIREHHHSLNAASGRSLHDLAITCMHAYRDAVRIANQKGPVTCPKKTEPG